MNAHELIKKDHRDIEKHYIEYLATGGDERRRHERMLLTALAVHAEIEDEIYYPEYTTRGKKDLVGEYVSEHNRMRALISKIATKSIVDGDTLNDMERLMGEISHHVEEEESVGIPLMEGLVSEARLMEMGEEMLERKKEIQKSTMKKLWAALPSI